VDLVEENSLDNSIIQEVVNERNFLGYYITSAKTGVGVIEVFNEIIDKLYHKYKELSVEL